MVGLWRRSHGDEVGEVSTVIDVRGYCGSWGDSVAGGWNFEIIFSLANFQLLCDAVEARKEKLPNIELNGGIKI